LGVAKFKKSPRRFFSKNGIRMKTKIKQSKSSNATSSVVIIGEGLDEWENRYIKLRVNGSDIPPFKVADLVTDPNQLFAALANPDPL
jgi:hypothetical protein